MTEWLNWTELRAITKAFWVFLHISNIGELGFICKTIFRKTWEITTVFFHSLAMVHLCYRYHLFIIFPFQLWLNIKLTVVLSQGRGWREVCMEPVFTHRSKCNTTAIFWFWGAYLCWQSHRPEWDVQGQRWRLKATEPQNGSVASETTAIRRHPKSLILDDQVPFCLSAAAKTNVCLQLTNYWWFQT